MRGQLNKRCLVSFCALIVPCLDAVLITQPLFSVIATCQAAGALQKRRPVPTDLDLGTIGIRLFDSSILSSSIPEVPD